MALAPHKEEIIGVVVESTYNWYWLVDGLMDAGYQVHLANPSAIKKYEGLKYSGDFADAAYLGPSAAPGIVARGLHLPTGTACRTRPCTQADAAGALPDGADSIYRGHPDTGNRRTDEQRQDQDDDSREELRRSG